VPQAIGRYQLIRLLGRGGMGMVYQGHDAELDRVVAIKVSPAFGPADGPRLDRFLREARLAARLEHPAILPLYEVGQAGDAIYIVSRFVDGTDLATRVRGDGPLAPGEAARLIEQVARGVHHAHQCGVLHRDIKPSNILVDREGRPFLGDFGLAGELEGNRGDHEATITREGAIMGTPAFMSPEQASGGFDRLGTATDVYGLGATLYSLLTGKRPFEASGAIEVLRQVVESDPVPPRRINPAVPRDLEALIIKAMSRDPRYRHSTAQELADELRRFLEGRPLLYGPPGPLRHTILTMQRRPRLAVVAAACIVIAMICLVTGLVRPWSPRLAPQSEWVHTTVTGDPGQLGPTSLVPGSMNNRSPRMPSEAEVTSQLESMARLRRAIAASAVSSCLRRLEEADRRLRDRPDDTSVRLALARESLNLGHIYGITSRPRDAVAAYERALVHLRALCEQNPAQTIYRTELAEAYRVLSIAYRALGRADEASKADRLAVSLSSASSPPARFPSANEGSVGP